MVQHAHADGDARGNLIQDPRRRRVGGLAGDLDAPVHGAGVEDGGARLEVSESLRGEVAGQGVHVTLLAPGPVRTHTPAPEDQSIVDKLVPDFLWIDSAYTARISLDGLEKNKMRIVPGILSKGMSVAGQYSPRSISAPIIGSFYKKLGGS